jgi:tyrosine-protein kinase Etk/Wzc
MRLARQVKDTGGGEEPAAAFAAGAAAAADGDLDLGALGRALWRKRWWVIAPTIAACVLSAVAVNFLTPKYKSEAHILYDGRENVFLRPEADKATPDRGGADPEAVSSQVQLVMSRELALDVIKQLKLNELAEFDPLLRGISPLRYLFAFTGLARDPTRMSAEERVLDAYYERLAVFPVDRTRVITIEFQSADPELAARVSNAIAERYLGLQQVAVRDQTRAAGEWLSGEIDSLRKKVAEAEAKVEDYRSKSNLFIGTNNTTLSNQGLGEVNSQLAALRAVKADAETRARLIRAQLQKGGLIEASEIVNSDFLRRLSEQRVTLRAQLAEQSSTLLDQHPRIKELKAQIADLDAQMRNEAEKQLRALESDARIAGARVETLSGNLDQLKHQAATTNGQDVQLRALEREARAQRDLLESYLGRYRETTARDSIATAPADARIISRANVSNTPFFPKRMPIVLVATLAALVISMGLAIAGELLGGGYGVRLVPAPPAVIASVAMPNVTPLDAPGATHPALGVPIAVIDRFARELRGMGLSARRIAVVGAVREVATSLAAITLARALVKDSRVVLVDLAFGAANLTVIAADPAVRGIADLVRGDASFGDIITRDRFSRLHVVTAGLRDADLAAMLAAPRLLTTLEALARTYDHVVIDAGAVPDIAVERFARLADKAVLIAAENDLAAVQSAQLRLNAGGFSDVTVLVGAPQATPEVADVAPQRRPAAAA